MNKGKSILIFGAGKIGRSFIGQLFGAAGYEVIFSDIDKAIVDLLNERKTYKVVIKGDEEETINVPNVRAIYGLDTDAVIKEVSRASVIATSVGKNALEKVIPLIGHGLLLRFRKNNSWPLDIIIAENMRSAADFTKRKFLTVLPADYPINKLVGLVETSIGKMVPIMKQADLDRDPLAVYAEAYNTLIADRKGFKGEVPQVTGLTPKENIRAWVDRKAFIHNLGHAAAAYYGYFLHPRAVYMYQILDDREVLLFTRAVMLQSAEILKVAYKGEYTTAELANHIDELIHRFRNKALQDTVYRVGRDLPRKLGTDDRFMGAIHLAMQYRMPYDLILEAMSYGLCFKAKDEAGNNSSSDIRFLDLLSGDFESTLIKNLALDPDVDRPIIEKLEKLHNVNNNNFILNKTRQ